MIAIVATFALTVSVAMCAGIIYHANRFPCDGRTG